MPLRDDRPHRCPLLGRPVHLRSRPHPGLLQRALRLDVRGRPAPEYGGYFNFSKDGVRVAGGMRNDGVDAARPTHWSVYLAVDERGGHGRCRDAQGSAVIVPAMPVGELGSMAVVTDPGGAAIGIWQPGLHKGFGIFGEPGTPSWFELHTRDYDASVQFYRDVFKWDAHPVERLARVPLHDARRGRDAARRASWTRRAFLPAGAPAGWSIYFGTDDTDKSLARIVDLGGKVVQPRRRHAVRAARDRPPTPPARCSSSYKAC